jgi:hypothetical protein
MPNAEFKQTVGSKAQVFHGTAKRTSGGLVKSDLMQNKAGRIVSKKAHAAGKDAIQRLRAAGFVAKKGEFKLFTPKSKKHSPAAHRPKTRAMTAANHKRRHNAAVKAWGTRRAHAAKVPSKGGFANNMMRFNNSRRNSRKNSRRNSRHY